MYSRCSTVIWIAAALLAATCQCESRLRAQHSSTHEDLHHYFHKTEETHAAAWSYTGKTGPEHWGELCPAYELADTGKQQSPIEISDTVKADASALEFSYAPAKIDLVYNGHTIQENEERGSVLGIEGKQFSLKQFHFHAPSEHTLNGKHAPMEMHLVHKDETGRVAVVAIMIQEGEHNAALAPVWEYLPTEINKQKRVERKFNAQAILPPTRDYYHYIGSFTTPPCTEDVLWYVLDTPITLSSKQIASFTKIINHNNRPIQPLNSRTVTRSAAN